MTEVRLHTTVRRIKSGKTGRTPKPMGVYDPSVTYVCDDNVAPYVCVLRNGKDIRDGIDYYIMVRNYSWNGTNEGSTPAKDAAKPASDSTRVWKVFDNFGMVAAEIAMINYGLLAGSVCCQQGDARNGYDYALQYSQTGQDGTTDYEKFDPTKEPWANGQKWKPVTCIDWVTGRIYTKNVKADGGTFENVMVDNATIGRNCTVKGSLRNPFVLNNESSIPDSFADNIAVPNPNTFDTTYKNLSWAPDQSGHRVTLVNYNYGNQSAKSSAVEYYAPSSRYFAEDGVMRTSLSVRWGEAVELLGYGTDTELSGWIVTGRWHLGNIGYGHPFRVLAYGKVVNGFAGALTFDAKNITCKRISTGTYELTLPNGWFNNTFEMYAMVCGYGRDRSNNRPCNACVDTFSSTTKITVLTSNDNGWADADFMFVIYSMWNFYGLTGKQ